MKKIKLALGIVALSISASASAMPDAVPGRWYENMLSTLAKLADAPGFCRVFSHEVCRD